MNRRRCFALTFVTLCLMSEGAVFAQAPDASKTAWPPKLDANVETKVFPGRKVEFFRHGTKSDWGYAQPQQDYFILVHPEKPRPDSPLYVVLHSAGHDAKSAFEIATEGAEGPRGHFLYYPPADCYGLFPDCRANGAVGDWWWGGPQPGVANPKNLGSGPSPTEKRAEETVNWVLSQYPTDHNRVYLTGISMGGSGSLGIGVPRGDLFASILVHVPAGAAHVEQRMQFPPLGAKPGVTHSDPPIVVAYSGVNDNWAKDQAVLINGMRSSKYAFIDFWGLSGHDSTRQAISAKNDLAFSFPWLEIRKNEAYPVFTNASSDNNAPWTAGADELVESTGQINGFFRWTGREDNSTSFAIELRLLKSDEVKSSLPFLKESTADVTLRRLQKFRVLKGKDCRWELKREGQVLGKGIIHPDLQGLFTIPGLTISQIPSVLTLTTDE